MTTSKGKKVKIIESVAVHWKNFGALLDFDPMGNRLEIIAVTERERPEECCRSMFQYWLDGNGVPATWSTLIDILKNCRLSVLAAEVKEALKTKVSRYHMRDYVRDIPFVSLSNTHNRFDYSCASNHVGEVSPPCLCKLHTCMACLLPEYTYMYSCSCNVE